MAKQAPASGASRNNPLLLPQWYVLLGISAGTVRIHRKNVYAKMRISSQRELFSIFMQSPIYSAS